jgi:hypothetical protein
VGRGSVQAITQELVLRKASFNIGTILKFLTFEQEAPYTHFAVNPTNYAASPG